MELIAVHGIVEEVREVGKEIEVVADAVRDDFGRGIAMGLLPFDRSAVAVGIPAVGGVDGAEASNQTVRDGPLRDLVGRVPGRAIAHAGDRPPVERIALRESQDAVHFLVPIGHGPRSVIVFHLEGGQQVAGAQSRRRCDQGAPEALVSPADPHHRLLEHVRVVDIRRTRGGEVALVGEVRTFGELDAAHQLRDQKIQIGIALTMSMGRHVDRHPSHARREVGPVIEIEAPQVVLIGFPLAAVLADDDAGHGFEYLAGPHDGPRLELPRGNGALTRGLRNTHQVLRRIGDVRKIGERVLAGDGHIGVQRQTQHRVSAHRPRAHLDLSTGAGKVNQRERHDIVTGWHRLDTVGARRVGRCVKHPATASHVHGHTRQDAARLVPDRT